MIAAPAFISLDVVEQEVGGRAAMLLQVLLNDSFIIGVGDVDVDLLAGRNLPDDPGQVFGDGVIFVRE